MAFPQPFVWKKITKVCGNAVFFFYQYWNSKIRLFSITPFVKNLSRYIKLSGSNIEKFNDAIAYCNKSIIVLAPKDVTNFGLTNIFFSLTEYIPPTCTRNSDWSSQWIIYQKRLSRHLNKLFSMILERGVCGFSQSTLHLTLVK